MRAYEDARAYDDVTDSEYGERRAIKILGVEVGTARPMPDEGYVWFEPNDLFRRIVPQRFIDVLDAARKLPAVSFFYIDLEEGTITVSYEAEVEPEDDEEDDFVSEECALALTEIRWFALFQLSAKQ